MITNYKVVCICNETSNKEMLFLEMVFKSIDLDLNTISVLVMENKPMPFEELIKGKYINLLLMIGVSFDLINLDIHMDRYRPVSFEGITFLMIDDLSTIMYDSNLKKRLWGCIQRIGYSCGFASKYVAPDIVLPKKIKSDTGIDKISTSPINNYLLNEIKIKAIPTKYNSYLFRSRLEARWAVFFDAMNIVYQYESEGYDLNGVWYLPDFYLPDFSGKNQDWFVEVKPKYLTEIEMYKCKTLAVKARANVWLAVGVPDLKTQDYITPTGEISFGHPRRFWREAETGWFFCGEWGGCTSTDTARRAVELARSYRF